MIIFMFSNSKRQTSRGQNQLLKRQSTTRQRSPISRRRTST